MSPEIRPPSPPPTEPAKARLRIAALAGLGLLALGGSACQHERSDSGPPLTLEPAARASRIEALRKEIAQDHATLEDLITNPDLKGQVQLHDDREIRAIADRLSEQVHALADLEAAEVAARRSASEPTHEETHER